MRESRDKCGFSGNNLLERNFKKGEQGNSWGNSQSLDKDYLNLFVGNIPSSMTYDSMKLFFAKFGELVSVFISARRNNLGRKFGFVKFRFSSHGLEARNKSHGTWLEGGKLQVNIARFERKIPAPQVPKRKDFSLSRVNANSSGEDQKASGFKSYKEVLVQPGKGKEVSKEARIAQDSESGFPEIVQEFVSDKGENSSGRINYASGKLCKISYEPSKNDLSWLHKSLVGHLRNPLCSIPIIDQFLMEGVRDIDVTMMGANMALLSFESEEEKINMFNSGQDWLSTWFSKVEVWSPGCICQERLRRIRLEGVPLHAWNEKFFKSVAELWGNFVSMDPNASSKRRLDHCSLLLMTKSDVSIPGSIFVDVGDKLFELKIFEDPFVSLFASKDNNLVHKSYSIGDSEDQDIEIEVLKDQVAPSPLKEFSEEGANQDKVFDLYKISESLVEDISDGDNNVLVIEDDPLQYANEPKVAVSKQSKRGCREPLGELDVADDPNFLFHSNCQSVDVPSRAEDLQAVGTGGSSPIRKSLAGRMSLGLSVDNAGLSSPSFIRKGIRDFAEGGKLVVDLSAFGFLPILPDSRRNLGTLANSQVVPAKKVGSSFENFSKKISCKKLNFICFPPVVSEQPLENQPRKSNRNSSKNLKSKRLSKENEVVECLSPLSEARRTWELGKLLGFEPLGLEDDIIKAFVSEDS